LLSSYHHRTVIFHSFSPFTPAYHLNNRQKEHKPLIVGGKKKKKENVL
jgi:hypothetical protein